MGLIGSYLGTLYCGGSGYYMSPVSFVRKPDSWVALMSKYKATHTQAPNFAFKLAARKFNALPLDKRPVDLDLSTLQHMFNAAEPVTPDAISDFEETFCQFGLPAGVIVPGYGLAEHTVYVTDRGSQRLLVRRRVLMEESKIQVVVGEEGKEEEVEGKESGEEKEGDENTTQEKTGNDDADDTDDDDSTQLIIGCGVPNQSIDVRIVDKNTCVELGEDSVGEIWVNSPSKAKGYFNREEMSKGVFYATLAKPAPVMCEVPEGQESKEEGKEEGKEEDKEEES
jgi:acyl-CoA synthetase (AMP-forming)/AMP-acid ligase II